MKRLFLALALAMALPANAANLQISPLGMTLTPQQKVESLRIKNAGTAPIRIQMRAFSWSQVAGETVETPTSDVRFGPGQFEIPAGATQIVRVIRTSPDKPTEQTYRVVISELPSATLPADQSGAVFLLNYNLPLFYRPAGATPTLSTSRVGGELSVSNTGTGTAHLSVMSVDGKPVNTGLVGYVLPGSTMRFPAAPGHKVDIKVNGEAKTWNVP